MERLIRETYFVSMCYNNDNSFDYWKSWSRIEFLNSPGNKVFNSLRLLLSLSVTNGFSWGHLLISSLPLPDGPFSKIVLLLPSPVRSGISLIQITSHSLVTALLLLFLFYCTLLKPTPSKKLNVYRNGLCSTLVTVFV